MKSSLVSLFFVVVLMGFVVALHFVPLSHYDSQKQNWIESDRIFTTNDAFYYLRLTEEYVAGDYSEKDDLRTASRPTPVPLMVVLTAGICKLTGFNVGLSAFFVSSILACLSIPVVWKISGLYMPDSTAAAVLACMVMAVNPAFYSRTTLGYYDTDCLNLVLFWGMIYGASLFSGKLPADQLKGAIWLILCSVVLFFWWGVPSVPFIIFGVLILFLPIVFDGFAQNCRVNKLFVFIVVVCLLLYACLVLVKQFFDFDLLRYILAHAQLVLGYERTTFFNARSDVAELGMLNFYELIRRSSGLWFTFVVALYGLVRLFIDDRKSILNIGLVFFFFIISSFYASRFLFLVAPCIAIGVAYAFYATSRDVRILKSLKVRSVFWLACLLLIVPAFLQNISYKIYPTYEKSVAVLARSLSQLSPEGSSVWNWWNSGYLIQYYGDRKTIIDEGLQNPYLMYVAAVPLAEMDPFAASNWIKFFSLNPEGIHVVTKYTHDKSLSIDMLMSVFKNPSSLNDYIEKYKMNDIVAPDDYFFPEHEVYIFLTGDLILKNSWFTIGRSHSTQSNPEDDVVYHLDRNRALIAENDKHIYYNNSTLPYENLFEISSAEIRYKEGSVSGYSVIDVAGVDHLFYLPERFQKSLVFKLLVGAPENTKGFELLLFNPLVGGIWKVT